MSCAFWTFSRPYLMVWAAGNSRGATAAQVWQRSTSASTSRSDRPLRRRRSSVERFSPGPKGRTKMTAVPNPSICVAIDLLRPATIALMPVTVMMPITTPRMVSPARIL